MAIDAKMSFMGQVDRGCADLLTKAQMEKTLRIISDVLDTTMGYVVLDHDSVKANYRKYA